MIKSMKLKDLINLKTLTNDKINGHYSTSNETYSTFVKFYSNFKKQKMNKMGKQFCLT
jgi:hypothetical protein